MAERQPVLLGSEPGDVPDPPVRAPAPRAAAAAPPRPVKREAPTVYVVGFWRRAIAALLDAAVVIPLALLVTWLVSAATGVHLPPGHVKLVDIDLWIDLILATEPALVMGLVLTAAIAVLYLLVFQITLGRTLGMRVVRIKIIDVYGERPSPARCAARCAGYIASLATLMLGFLWMGFDSEKRGLHDWIAGTYVIRA
jgi:uncharacterized RDD family membrane protein YckC